MQRSCTDGVRTPGIPSADSVPHITALHSTSRHRTSVSVVVHVIHDLNLPGYSQAAVRNCSSKRGG